MTSGDSLALATPLILYAVSRIAAPAHGRFIFRGFRARMLAERLAF
jgi:hypothetical protein